MNELTLFLWGIVLVILGGMLYGWGYRNGKCDLWNQLAKSPRQSLRDLL